MNEMQRRASGRLAGRKIKVTDVAKRAGVSPSTVDRVLNARAGVRPDTVRLVEEAMAELGYATNALAARMLTPTLSVDVVLPRGTNPFFKALHDEFLLQAERLDELGTRLRIAETDVFDTASLTGFLRSYEAEPDRALIVVAQEAPEVRQAIDDLAAKGLVIITLISDSTRSARRTFVGIDNFAAGRTAGALMARFLGARSGDVGVLVGHLGLRDHLDRRSGFEQAMAELRPDCDVALIGASRDDDSQSEELVRASLEKRAGMVGIYNAGAANAGVFKSLATKTLRPVVIAHELTPENRHGLIDGLCDALIVQDVAEAARRAVEAAISLRLPKGAESPMTIGILIKENLPWANAL
jgi:LacI family transcriptional regulator